jgi:glycosyltransferase involved in cell wall biosynthesis
MALKQNATKIVFATMVKNESKIIKTMLESVAPYIDYWVIEDTGSTDGTQQIIRDFFAEKNIPGFVYEEPWKFHGYNRDNVLQKTLAANAEHGCDYILRVDADEKLEVSQNFDWSIFKQFDAWNVPTKHGGILHYRKWVWSTKLPWHFAHDPIHETIHCPVNYTVGNLPISFKTIVMANGASYTNPKKYYKDGMDMEMKMMVLGDKEAPNKDLYHLWYTAKSYYDAYNSWKYLAFGLDHGKECLRRARFYFEQHLKITERNLAPHQNQDENLFYTYFLLGHISRKLEEPWETAQALFLKASSFAHNRVEGLFEIISYYFNKNDMPTTYAFSKRAYDMKNPFPKSMHFIEYEKYSDTGWQLLDMHSVAAYWTEHYEECYEICKTLLSDEYREILPVEQRPRIQKNLEFSRERM